MRLGMGEVLVILVIALLVFGPNKIPQLGDSMGKALRSFKKAMSEDDAPPTRSDPAAVSPSAAVPPAATQASGDGKTT